MVSGLKGAHQAKIVGTISEDIRTIKNYLNLKIQTMRVMFGGRTDPYDVHVAGFDEAILGFYLGQSGFKRMHRVKGFGLFEDASRAAHESDAARMRGSHRRIRTGSGGRSRSAVAIRVSKTRKV